MLIQTRGDLMAVVETDNLVDGERLRMAVLAFREAGDHPGKNSILALHRELVPALSRAA
jgi:hypothetical protein